MKRYQDNHVNEKDLIRAVVDVADLPVEIREHLESCPVCRTEQELLTSNLEGFGALAQRYAPDPSRAKLPAREQSRLRWTFSWRFATAFAAMLLLAVTWWTVPLIKDQDGQLDILIQQMDQDAELLATVEYLEDNPLPASFADMSGESTSALNEDFFEFVAPTDSHEPALTPHSSFGGEGVFLAPSFTKGA